MYPTLPFEYVIEAYANFARIKLIELHAYERPIAMHAQLTASMNIDRKKQKRPSIEQFYLYQPIESKNLPEARYGAAVKELIKQNIFPAWGLFCYKDLVYRAGSRVPEVLCFMSDTAILIAPTETPNGYKGLLIALEEASGETLEMKSPCGRTVSLTIPYIHTKVIAKEDVILQLAK